MHDPTPEQIDVGVYNHPSTEFIRTNLLFESIPTMEDLEGRAMNIVDTVAPTKPEAAMIGGASYLMAHLERELREHNIRVMYSFTKRDSVEKVIDGKVIKTSVFKHVGFVEA